MDAKRMKNPRKSLNPAFLKMKPQRSEIEKFKIDLASLLDNINEKESEEFNKNLIAGFLKKSRFEGDHFINTKDRKDLVIHNSKDSKSSVGVIIEAKKPSNSSEMIKTSNLNGKALQELVLYYLRERISSKNTDLKYLIVTNVYEWFIFDAHVFEKYFGSNSRLVKQFSDFENKVSSGSSTDFFYKEIASQVIEAVKSEIEFTYFDIRNYENYLRNKDKTDDSKLIPLFKLFSPEHLLKLPFQNDSMSSSRHR